MNEAERRRWLDRLTILLLESGEGEPMIFNGAGLPAFALITPGACAYSIGGIEEIQRAADLLGAFETGDVDQAAALMGVPPLGMS